MDIEQMKKYFKNKIDSEKLTKKVRDVIKTTDWQKQDMREGFKESFSPLIESQDSIKKSIDEQQNKTIEQLKKNQLALTDKENMLEQLTASLLSIMGNEEDDGDGRPGKSITLDDTTPSTSDDTTPSTSDDTKTKKKFVNILPHYFDEKLNNKEIQEILKKYNFDNLPSHYFFDKNVTNVSNLITKVTDLINTYKVKFLPHSADFKMGKEGYEIAEPRNKNPQQKTLMYIKHYNTLSTYLSQLNKLYAFKTHTTGKGINNYKSPLQLLDRLELLSGSIIAGNNGVLQEFSEIAHLLARMKVITKKQLNELIKWGHLRFPLHPPPLKRI